MGLLNGEKVMPISSRQAFLYGLFFCTVCVLFWSALPIVLKLSGGFSDPATLTWLRFSVAGIILLAWQGWRGKLYEFTKLTKKQWLTLAAAGSLLIINYSFFAWSLDFLHPGVAQLSFQVAPLFLALGGMIFFKEKIRWPQWLCFAVLGLGMVIFFHPVLSGQISGDPSILALGFLIVQTSACAWCFYALLQKSLFKVLSSTNILLGIYMYALVVMLPFTSPSDLLEMNSDQALVAAFCCFNTLIAYGAFAQALNYWQTVQVSASIALTPVIAFIATEACVALGLWQGVIISSHADSLSLFGMALVVGAAISVQFITAALNKRQARLDSLQTTTA